MTGKDDEGFFGRWSRRKLAPAAGHTERPDTAPSDKPATTVAANEDAFADFDFTALDFNSDYRRFMTSNIPEPVRTRALQQLWTSSDLIGRPDELDEFLEDFRDQAKAVPSALARSAYEIGRGFADAEAESTALGIRDDARQPAEVKPDSHDSDPRAAIPDGRHRNEETTPNRQVPRPAGKG